LGKKTFLAFSCPHFPLNDPLACDWLFWQIAERQPDVIVHLGDGHEAASASRWPNENYWSLSHEFETHNEFLKSLREAAPKAIRVFLPGNHDDNLLSLNRIDRQLRDLCDYRKNEPELEHWLQPVPYVYDRNRGVFRLGQVTFCHGFEAGVSSDEFQALQLGLPYGLFVSGHTHQPKAVTQAHRTKSISLPYWYANAGCMREMFDVPWMSRRRRAAWGQAIVVGEAEDWRYSTSLMPQSPLWEAETIVFRTFEGTE